MAKKSSTKKKTETKDKSKADSMSFDYKVKFKDGLKPKVVAYSINPETKELTFAHAILFPVVGAGYHLKDEIACTVLNTPIYNYGEGGYMRIVVSKNIAKGSIREHLSVDQWEKGFNTIADMMGVNMIKVDDPELVSTAIERHAELYQKQLVPLTDKVLSLFKQYMKKNPGYDIIDGRMPIIPGKKA